MNSIGSWLARHADLPRLELEVLLGHLLGLTRSQIIAFPERELPAATVASLSSAVTRLRKGEPLAYVTGSREFWSLPFRVSPAVLIPRPDTELLVSSAIERLSPDTQVLDLGTGSGVIAICLARTGLCQVTATDLCREALAVAAQNAADLNAGIQFLESRWFDRIAGRYHMIVSNPPYVADADPHLAALGFEPRTALVSGPEGLDDLQEIIRGAADHLHDNGWLLLEHGYNQGAAVRELLDAAGFGNIETLQDLGQQERVSVARWSSR